MAYTGSGAYLKFGATEYNTYYRSAPHSEEIDLVDKSAGADTNKTYLTALKDGSAGFELVIPVGTAGSVMYAAFVPGTSGTLEIGPEGTATGEIKSTVMALVKTRGLPLTYNDLTTLSVAFQFNGAVTDTCY